MKVTYSTSSSRSTGGRKVIRFDSSMSGSSKSTSVESLSEDEQDYTDLFKSFKVDCEKLKKHAKEQKFDLDESTFELVDRTSAILSRSYDNVALYSKLHEIVVSVFGEFRNPEPGSVASHFVGCAQTVKYSGKMSCTAQCAGAIPLPKSSMSDFCDTHVGSFKNGVFEHSYIPNFAKSDIILIHNMDDEVSLSSDEVADLRQKGIRSVIVSKIVNGKYVARSEEIDVNAFAPKSSTKKTKLPTKAAKKEPKKVVVEQKQGKQKTEGKEKDESGWNWGIILFIVFVFIVLILFALYYVFAWGGTKTAHSDAHHPKHPLTSHVVS